MALDLTTLLELERQLAHATNGDPYREILAPHARVVVPGFVLDRENCAMAMDASPGWDRVDFENEQLVRINSDAAALVYRFTGLRGDDRYIADMVSCYADTSEGPRLVTHQHTMHWEGVELEV